MLSSCSTGTDKSCRNEIVTPCIPVGEPHKLLTEYNLFRGDLSQLEPVQQLLPYDLDTPLFSDYAEKYRFLYLPEGKSVVYSDSGTLDFPVGTVLVKNFLYPGHEQDSGTGRIILETRLLVRYETGWRAETYVWNDEQDEAVLQRTGDTKEVTWTDIRGIVRRIQYLVPSKNDCKNCHARHRSLVPLGPTAANLNKTFQYPDGPENQLSRWEMEGILGSKPDSRLIPRAPVWNDASTGTVSKRARMYLDVNCAHCHNPVGSANNSGLYLQFHQDDPFRLGICKSPVSPGPGSGGFKYNIVPCEPEKSILVFRIKTVEPEKRMPEIGRTLVHEEAVALIRRWIGEMECRSCEIK
ncbi:MAG: SO2930 family diheme c-type cytochrome [Balneolaceae bacterium]|nr:SO2930 family diheme c-type cytochrome [Balneolaceae bacterium]